MREREITSLNDFLKYLLSPDEFFNSHNFYCYRGQIDIDWQLIPSVFRGLQNIHENDKLRRAEREILKIEEEIYKDFKDFVRSSTSSHGKVNIDNVWEMLCFAQHFDAPTRLLDWTSNPLVAAYFAVTDWSGNYKTCDGAIVCMNVTKASPKSENSYLRTKMRGQRLSDLNAKFLDYLGKKGSGKLKEFQIIQPPYIDDRIKNQAGLFSVYIPEDSESERNALVWNHGDYLTQKDPNCLLKIKIPHDKKKSIKNDLEKLGINPNLIFPDMYGLGRLLKDWHTKRFFEDILT